MTESQQPWYKRTAFVLLGISLTIMLLFVGKDLFVPLVFGALLAVLLYPLADFLDRHSVPRLLSILIAVTIACIVSVGFLITIGTQVAQFGEEIPLLKKQSMEYVDRAQAFIKESWGITYKDQLKWFQQWWQQGGEMLHQALLKIMDITSLVVLVPLYAFLILIYKDLIIDFFFNLFAKRNAATINTILQESRTVVTGYLTGLMIETMIIAVLNTSALLLLGIDYAILFGVLAAALNLIPYIGILIGAVFPLLMAVITKDSAWYPLGVVTAFIVIQFIDNNLIVPYIVASRIRINALASIIAVIIGGTLWGISGMFISLPAVAILKVIFSKVEALKPWGLILGDDILPKRVSRNARLN